MHKKRKKQEKVNKVIMIATVDIGKFHHIGYWRCSDGSESNSFKFSNTLSGFDAFWMRVYTAQQRHGVDLFIIGIESTGPYGKPLIHYLYKKPVKLVQVNPFHSKRVKELSDNSPLKTDRKDPRVIADIIMLGHWLTLVIPKGIAAELRELVHEREVLVRLRTAAYNRLRNIMSVLFPELLTIIKDVRSKSAHYLITHYPMPHQTAALTINELTETLKQVSRKKLSTQRIETLYKAAHTSIGVREGANGMVRRAHHCLSHIRLYNQQITELEKQMNSVLLQHHSSRYLLSIKGVSTITASVLIGEIGDFDSFSTQRAIMKLAGLNLYEISSGVHRGIRRIAKRGRYLLRKILFYAAMNVVRKDGILHEYYQQLLKRNMPRVKALIAVSRKLLCIMFALVRGKTLYQQEYSINTFCKAV